MNHTSPAIEKPYEPTAAMDRFVHRLGIVNKFVELDSDDRIEVLAMVLRELSVDERTWLNLSTK